MCQARILGYEEKIRKAGGAMSKVGVMQERWDYLIILDACRYDYFERIWQNYLQGSLEKRKSIASTTIEWRNKSFREYHPDVIYISANPYITSVAPVKGFSAKEHFYKVYDLVLNNWDSRKCTVLPETVTKRAIDIINANSDKRAIIHYIQPHEPYLGCAAADVSVKRPQPRQPWALEQIDQDSTKFKISNCILKTLSGILYWLGIRGNLLIWRLREFMAMPPANPMDAVRREYGKELLRQAYKENLEIVLKHVATLVDTLQGRIVITADHGEALGERGCYGHWSRARIKSLVEIPWLVIDKARKVSEPTEKTADKKKEETQPSEPLDKQTNQEAKRKIQEKLKALGYY